MNSSLVIVSLALALVAAPHRAPTVEAPSPPEPLFDLVVAGGRVIDPESGLDAVLDVGIRGGEVQRIASEPLSGRRRIDARGLVVAPGFIDLHQHSFSPEALLAKARDGVTTAIDLELGAADVDAWYAALEGRSPIHFGASVSHLRARRVVLGDPEPEAPPHANDGSFLTVPAEVIPALRARVEEGLDRGAVGVGLAVGYTPGATPWEVLEMFRAAAGSPGAPVAVHVRDTDPPQHWMETAELFLGAVVSGAPLHIVHANSSYGGDAPRLLAMIEAARARGLDVTTEAYPYTAAMTLIESAPFADWESWREEDFADFEWPPTGERLTRESFGRYREEGGAVVIHGMTEEKLRPALASPLTAIVSDGVLENGSAHPRLAGTYARVLGRYVREEGVLTLPEALRKMTLLPAQRLEARATAMGRKGRIRVGADADLTIFDPATVRDRATYAEPLLPSQGIRWVLVAGTPVVAEGEAVAGALPGQAIRGPIVERSTAELPPP